MSGKQLLFSFPDGLLSYNCSNCHSKACCRGSGLNLSPSGRGALLLRSCPAMQMEVQPQSKNMLFAPHLPSGCRFIDKAGNCTLYGQEKRPPYCELYPFTLMAIVGDTIVSGPDPRCPLTVNLDGQGIKHQEISSLFDTLEPCVIPVELNCSEEDLPREILIRDTAGDCLKNGDSLGSLLAFSSVVTAHSKEDLSSLELSSEMDKFFAHLGKILPDWLQLIGLGESEENPNLDLERILLANFTSQRLFGRWEDLSTFDVAFAGLGSYLFRLPKDLQARTTPLDICQYFSSLEPLLWHLVHWADKPHYIDKSEPRAKAINKASSWGKYLMSCQQNLPAATIVELRLIYEDLREGLSWN